jgi:hypothetical protein
VSVPRPALVLYLVAWLLVLAAAACIGASARGFLASTSLLWAAVGLGATAILVAVASVLVRRKG